MILIDSKEGDAHSFMRLSKKEAEKSKSRFKMGAVLVKGKRVLGRGYNKKREHPDFGSGLFSCFHAEGAALYDALRVRPKEKIRGSTLYIFRRNHTLSRPCPDCQKLLKQYGIKKVIFSS